MGTGNAAKRALITGVTGQDGSYLAELLLSKGYDVWGIVRRTSSLQRGRIDHLHQLADANHTRFHLVYGDLQDGSSLHRVLQKFQPQEVYNLAAQSHVQVSFEIPEYTVDVDAMGTVRILEAIRSLGLDARFYQASSSEMFGKVLETPQNETTPFYPRSPYAAAKVFSFHFTRNYREAYGLFAVNGILFNHESPRRGENFVTRKITLAAARIRHGHQDRLHIGNLDAKRDWGYAADFVDAMWRMLQAEEPEDYVIATGESHSVREFCEVAFSQVGLPLRWQGERVEEKGVGPDGQVLVEIDPAYFRPTEVDLLVGDPSKARAQLGWTPGVTFDGLVKLMLEADLELVSGGGDAAAGGTREGA